MSVRANEQFNKLFNIVANVKFLKFAQKGNIGILSYLGPGGKICTVTEEHNVGSLVRGAKGKKF